MKKIRKIMISMLSVFTLLIGCVMPAMAAEYIPEVTFDADAEVFSYENTDTYTDADGTEFPDLFTEFKGAIPGDSFTQEIIVNAENIEAQTVNIYLHSENANEDYETIMESVLFTVTYEGEEIASGTLEEGILLGSFTADDTMDIVVEMAIPITVGNEIADLYGTIDWVFVAELIDDEPEENPTEDPTEDSTEDLVQTGDNSNFVLWSVLLIVAISGMLSIVYKSKNK